MKVLVNDENSVAAPQPTESDSFGDSLGIYFYDKYPDNCYAHQNLRTIMYTCTVQYISY